MRNARWAPGFERAVLLALALPAAACGGRSEMLLPDDGGIPVNQPLPEAGPDGATCAWTVPSPSVYCNWTVTFTGDPQTCAGFALGSGTPAQCAAVCGRDSEGEAADTCSIYTGGGESDLSCTVTSPTASCQQQFIGNGGRRPDYFASLGFGPAPAGRDVGTHFARVACMEAGSVDAFRMLRDELRAHGAPRRLVQAASRAMRDEMRHVRQTSALARRFGERPIAPRPVPVRPPRDLESLALENATEGCVRETYSALECLWQAHAAADPVVRATMTRIAADEMRHLELSWAVHAWAMSRLDAAARARVKQGQKGEVAALVRELGQDPALALVRSAGLPRAAQSRALVHAIDERLAS